MQLTLPLFQVAVVIEVAVFYSQILVALSVTNIAARHLLHYFRPSAQYTFEGNTGCAIQNHLLALGGTPLLNRATQISFLYSNNGTHTQFMKYTAYNCSNTTDYESLAVDYLFFLDKYLLPGLSFTSGCQIVTLLPMISTGRTAKVLSAFALPITHQVVNLNNLAINYLSYVPEGYNPHLPDAKDLVIPICKLIGLSNLVCNLAGSAASDLRPYHNVSYKNTNKAVIKSCHQLFESICVEVFGDPAGYFLCGWTRELVYDITLSLIPEEDRVWLQSSNASYKLLEYNITLPLITKDEGWLQSSNVSYKLLEQVFDAS